MFPFASLDSYLCPAATLNSQTSTLKAAGEPFMFDILPDNSDITEILGFTTSVFARLASPISECQCMEADTLMVAEVFLVLWIILLW